MTNKKLTPKRKRELKAIVKNLKLKYGTNGEIDYNSLCNDSSIKYYEDLRIAFPAAILRKLDERGNPITSPQRAVFCFPYRLRFVKKRMMAHEFAHHLLGHMEQILEYSEQESSPYQDVEANYLARKLTEIDCNHWWIDALAVMETIFRNPNITNPRRKESDVEILLRTSRDSKPLYPMG